MRIFIAADIPEDQLSRLSKLRQELPGWRWLPPQNLHFTLAFLGELPRPEPVLERLSRLEHARVRVRSSVLRAFSRRVLALEFEGLDSLALQVRELLGELHTESRPYRGHVTLARAGKRACKPAPQPVEIEFVCRSVSCQLSQLTPAGARYQTLGRFELRG